MQTLSGLRAVITVWILSCLPCQYAESVTLATMNDTLAESTIPVASRSSERPTINIELLVNGKLLRAHSAGECQYEPNGSIYSAPASLWRVEYSDPKSRGIRHLSLTVWQLKSGGPNQLSLALESGPNSHRIATVKGGKMAGTGTVILQREQSGGRFEVKGTDERGATIEMRISCPTFSNIVAEGG
jgi:hypothetical protein